MSLEFDPNFEMHDVCNAGNYNVIGILPLQRVTLINDALSIRLYTHPPLHTHTGLINYLFAHVLSLIEPWWKIGKLQIIVPQAVGEITNIPLTGGSWDDRKNRDVVKARVI